MATSSVSLGGLPDISSGGIDLRSIAQIASLMNTMDEMKTRSQARGTPNRIIPGSPEVPYSPGTDPSGGLLTATKPWWTKFGIGGYSPVKGIENVPSGATAGPGATDLLMGGGTAYLKGGTPGTPTIPYQPAIPEKTIYGTPSAHELAIKASLAENQLIAPQDIGNFMEQTGFKQFPYTEKKGAIVYVNPNGDISETKKTGYFSMDPGDAVKLGAENWRAKIAASATAITQMETARRDILHLSQLERLPGSANDLQLKAIEETTKQLLPGISGAYEKQKQILNQRISLFQKDKMDAMSAIHQIGLSTEISTREKKKRAKRALDRLRKSYPDLGDNYDITLQDEKVILGGF